MPKTSIGFNFATNYTASRGLIKKALGPSEKKTPPPPFKIKFGEPITDPKEQMVRLVEHYSELYLRETVVYSIIPLPVMDELSAGPTIREFSKAIDALLNGNGRTGKVVAAIASHPR